MHVFSENQDSQKNLNRTVGLESIRVRSIPGYHTGFGHNTIASTLIVTLSVKGASSEWERQSYMSLALMADFDFYLTCRIFLKSRPMRLTRDLKSIID